MSQLPFESSTSNLLKQIERARLWLPIAIIGVVLLHQLVVVPLGGKLWQFWVQLLFYSLIGPTITFLTLAWIASQVQEREQAEHELRRLYAELQASHELLSTIQSLTEQLATATDLESAISMASRGISEATGAHSTSILIGASHLGITRSYNLSPGMAHDSALRNRATLKKAPMSSLYEEGGMTYHVLNAPITWAGKTEGSVNAYYHTLPGPEQHEAFNIVTSEFSAATEATRGRTRDLLTLFEVDRSIRAQGNLDTLLATLLSQMMARAEATIGGVYLADEDHLLQLRLHQRADGLDPPTSASISTMPVRVGEGLVGQAAAKRKPSVTKDITPHAKHSWLLSSAGSAISLPLISETELLGVVVLAHENQAHFHEANLPFLDLLAGQVSLAVRNARAYLYSEELAIAEERARIASEIHDGVAQTLAFSALKSDLIMRLLDQPEKAKAELHVLKTTLRDTIQEVRRSIFALRPIDLERYGFIDTIRRYMDDYGLQNNLHTHLDIQELPKLSVKSEVTLYRIFQESMHNVAKHAKAKHVWVCIGTNSANHAFISIKDDGVGFDLQAISGRVTSAGGLGLKQMHERLDGRGGTFTLTSQKGQGTTVTASLPE